jgi:HEPN domain-containing protein
MVDEKAKSVPSFLDLLSSFRLSSIFRRKEPEEEASYPLADAKRDWAEAMALFQAGQYDRATQFFRSAVENLIKANCPGWGSVGTSNLLELSKKAFFGEPPAEVTEALAFLNPHRIMVRSVYNYDFACEARDRARLVIDWIREHRPSHSTFDPDHLPPRKIR